jgi:hypothetical protein
MAQGSAPVKIRIWNIWWTLMWISIAATIVVAILEALGVFDDVGIALSIVGLLLSIGFGVMASTRSAVSGLGGHILVLHDEIRVVRDGITALGDGIGAVREEIGRVRAEVGAVREEVGTVRGSIETLHSPLARIVAILEERLPPAPLR